MTAPAAPMHDVKSASAVLAEDVICQSFVQSSSTLAYACLLIRRGNYDLAIHVLHSLEAKQASRFRDMVFYLQSQIGIETGDFATVKRRLVPRVHQHPNDMVALSLLECCIYLEFVEWEKQRTGSVPAIEPGAVEATGPAGPARPIPEAEFSAPGESGLPVRPGPSHRVQPGSIFGNAEAELAARHAAAYERPQAPGSDPDSMASGAGGPSVFAGTAADSGFSESAPVPLSALAPSAPDQDALRWAPPSRIPAAPPAARVPSAPPGGTSPDLDFGQFQALANDVNAQALALWNPEKGRFKSSCRNAGLEPLMEMLPHEVPMSIQAACTSLDCGVVTKISFAFQQLTVTTFHAGSENLGLATGNINQSLLTIVRAENTFRKQAAAVRPAEYAPNE